MISQRQQASGFFIFREAEMRPRIYELRAKRLLLGISQWEVGRRVGKSAAWVSLVERGYLHPDKETQAALRQVLRGEEVQDRSADFNT